ncbi:MAG TPA: helix-turn-helix domain-containing protein [Ktedonobacterales bacterium]|jgi:hypothetical protein|nr:helix-turn-helix domain-containing protein [Ktedonobacterales bacterium]
MSHVIELSDRAYEILSAFARQRGQSLEELLEALATQRVAERDSVTDPRYETFEEFFQGLGMSPDEIKAAQESAESDADV